MRSIQRIMLGIVATATVSMPLVACSGETDPEPSSTDWEAALQAGGEITVWAWEPTLQQVTEQFQQDYPNVTVNLVNAGTGGDHYTALSNALAAGSGIPDVAQVEYYALPQYALSDALADLTPFGAADLDGVFTPGPWSSVQAGGGIYGLPMDSGPMALFYNAEVFDTYDIEVPATWDEFVEAGRKLKAANPDAYITNDTGDAGFTTSLIWQAGGQPYTVDGTSVGIDFGDAGSQKFAQTWQQMIDEELVAPVGSWSDAWFQGLSDGTIASLVIGAWMPANLESGAPAASGRWRVAPMPAWEAGSTATAENGGSSLAVMKASSKAALAYGYVHYANVAAGVQIRLDNGAFPATTEHMNSPEFLNKEFDYFGGQKANEIFAGSAANVVTGWSYLPFQVYANSIFNDTVGQAYVSDTSLAEGLAAWQEQSIEYGTDQGFTVS